MSITTEFSDLDFEPEEPQAILLGPELTWAERMEQDETLRAFVQAEIERAGIGEHVARLEEERWRGIALHWERKCAELREEIARLRKESGIASEARPRSGRHGKGALL